MNRYQPRYFACKQKGTWSMNYEKYHQANIQGPVPDKEVYNYDDKVKGCRRFTKLMERRKERMGSETPEKTNNQASRVYSKRPSSNRKTQSRGTKTGRNSPSLQTQHNALQLKQIASQASHLASDYGGSHVPKLAYDDESSPQRLTLALQAKHPSMPINSYTMESSRSERKRREKLQSMDPPASNASLKNGMIVIKEERLEAQSLAAGHSQLEQSSILNMNLSRLEQGSPIKLKSGEQQLKSNN